MTRIATGTDTSKNINHSGIDIRKSTLPNGIRIITEHVPTVESFALGVFIDAGSRDEWSNKSGVAHFLEHASFRRTKTRTSRRIATEFESIGAYTNAFTTQESTCFYVRALKENFDKCSEILSDIVVNPLFKDKEINRERRIILEEIKSYEDDPEEYILDIGDRHVYGNHPLGNPIVGTKESVEAITIGDLEKFRSDFYHGGNIIVTLAGNVSHENALDLLSTNFADIAAPTGVNRSRVAPQEVGPVRQTITRQIQQSHLLVSRRVCGLLSPERFKTALLNIIFGDGMSSKLYQSLREKHGLAYSVYSSLELQSDCGAFYIYAGCDPANLQNAEELIFEEMEKIIKSGISSSDIKRSKEQLKSGLVMELESMSERIRTIAKSETLLGRYEPVPEIIKKIEAVSREEIHEAAEHYFKRESFSTAKIVPRDPAEE